MERNNTYIQRNSFIQVPIRIDTQDIEKAILAKINNPISQGQTKKYTTDIFATEEISQKEFSDTFFKSPLEAMYKYSSEDISNEIDNMTKVAGWVRHKVYLKKLDILFEDSLVKIFTSYTADLSANYEQRVIPFLNPGKIKGLIQGSVEADINLVGKVTIDDNAQLRIEAFEDQTKIEFKKILFPASIDALDVLKVTGTKKYFTEDVLEKPISKHIFNAVEEQIAKTQIDLNLAQRIQQIVQDHTNPLNLAKDLWLIPEAERVSISQVKGEGDLCSNTLSIYLGVVAKPKLITSETEPPCIKPDNVPIVCEKVDPRIYLYPSLNIKYDFMEKTLEEELKNFINKKHPHSPYTIGHVDIYPSDKKIVLAIDLLEKSSHDKVVTFYLWGVPKVEHQNMLVKLTDFDYTVESKNVLVDFAAWILDEEVRAFIQKSTVFPYGKEFTELSQKISNISYESGEKIITGNIDLVGVEQIFSSKDSLVINALATGDLSYKINLGNEYDRK